MLSTDREILSRDKPSVKGDKGDSKFRARAAKKTNRRERGSRRRGDGAASRETNLVDRVADGPASFLLSLLATQRLRGGFGVWMRHEDLSDLEFLNLNLLQVVNPKPEG